jgi:diphosphate--fructose-6-phosphate 1-phosphotransferase
MILTNLLIGSGRHKIETPE